MKRLVLLLSMLVLFSSCSFFPGGSGSSNELMQPPILSQMQKDIYDELSKVLDIDSIVYQYPNFEGQHSPFVIYDINNDGLDEVIIFFSYKTNQQEMFAKVMVQNEEGDWKPFYDMPCYSSQISFVDFAPLKSIGQSSIIIGWLNEGTEHIAIYTMTTDKIEVDFLEPYNAYIIDKNTPDKLAQLLLVQSENNQFSLKLYNYINNTFKAVSSVSLYEETAKIKQLLLGTLGANNTAVYIDEELSGASTSYSTEIVSVANNKLEVLIGYAGKTTSGEDNEGWNEFVKTFRSAELSLSTDIMNDGVIEVPTISEHNTYGQVDSDASSAPKFIEYMQLEDKSLVVKYNSVRNENFEYLVHMPDRWVGNIIIVDHPQRKEWRFHRVNPITGQPGTELLRVRRFYSNEYLDEISDDDFLLAKKGLFSFYGYIPTTSAEALAVTEKEVLDNMFELI